MKRIVILLFASAFAFSCVEAKEKPEVKVTPVGTEADAANGGLIYALPKTMLRIRVEAEVVIKKVGPYYKYSNKYLNISDVVTEDAMSWRLLSASIESYGMADYSRRYLITSIGAEFPSLSLSNSGVLMGVNADVVADALPADESMDSEIPEITFDDVRLGRSVLTKTSTTAMAEEIALSIYRLRDKRMSLLGGEDATILNDEGSYNKVLAEIDALEDSYMSLFAGKVVKKRVVKYFTVEPGATSTSGSVLFRFSEKEGFMSALDIAGKPVYVDVEFESNKVNALSADSKLRQKAPITGLRYLIPGTMNVKVVDRNRPIAEGNFLCSQHSQEASLAPEVLTDGYSVVLDQKTGALVKIAKLPVLENKKK